MKAPLSTITLPKSYETESQKNSPFGGNLDTGRGPPTAGGSADDRRVIGHSCGLAEWQGVFETHRSLTGIVPVMGTVRAALCRVMKGGGSSTATQTSNSWRETERLVKLPD